jgi:hypothetical protein
MWWEGRLHRRHAALQFAQVAVNFSAFPLIWITEPQKFNDLEVAISGSFKRTASVLGFTTGVGQGSKRQRQFQVSFYAANSRSIQMSRQRDVAEVHVYWMPEYGCQNTEPMSTRVEERVENRASSRELVGEMISYVFLK